MIRLVIEDVEVDLGEADIQIDYSIAKIGEIESRSGSRSAQINLPKTVNNRLVFENSDVLNNLTNRPYRRLKARLYTDGIDQRILFASLESVTDTYNIRVYGDNVSFFDIVKSKKLIQLDLKEYDHYRTFANIKNGRNRTDGYLYPVIDYHSDSPNLYFDNSTPRAYVQYLYPAMYYEDCINQMCIDAGYTLVNRITELVNYPADKICIPYSSVKFERNKDMRRYDATIETSSPTASAGITFVTVAFDTPVNYEYKYWDGNSLSAGALLFLDVITCDVVFTFEVENTDVVDLLFNPKITDGTGDIVFQSITVPASSTITHTITLSNYQSQGSLQATFQSNSVGNIIVNTANVVISNSELVTFEEGIQYNNGIYSFTTINSLLPDWTQAELLSTYLKMFCGLISVDEFTKTVTLFSFENILKNIPQGKDWSDKIDLTDEENVEFAFDYSQNNSLEYEEDETVIKPTGTDGEILIDDENLEGFGEMIKLKFAATENVVRLVGEHVSQIKMWSNVGSPDAAMDLVKQRVLVVKFEDFGFDYTDGLTTQTVTTDIPVCYFIQPTDGYTVDFNLGFENNLLNYYNTFETVLDKTKILTLKLRLNSLDINQLDLTKPVYINHFNSWFYISQIKGYNPNNYESTECELVKLF